MRRSIYPLAIALLALAGPTWAQEEEPGAEHPAPAAAPSGDAALEARLTTLEQELAKLRAEQEKDGQKSLFTGWQLQLRGGWFTLAHNHRQNVFSRDDHQHGWMAGVSFMIPLWNKLAGAPVDLVGHLSIDFRQLAYSDEFVAPITGAQGTANYLNVIAGPVIRLAVSDLVRPFVLLAANMQVASPPQDAITYLDLGFTLGVGVDFKVHDHVSVGLDYKYSWFGVGDQEDEDYGLLSAYIGFNF